MTWTWLVAGVGLACMVAALAWNVYERRRLDAFLHSLTDAELDRLARRYPGGRQSRWIHDERRRRGIA